MPLSELYRSLNGKNELVSESPQQKATNISYMPHDEFMELVWEKGQVMMQGQSSKAKKTPVSSHFQFHTSKDKQRQDLLDVELPRIEMGLNEDDDMVPWLNYPLEDYCSQLLPEVSSVTVNEPSRHSHTQNNVSLNHSVCLDASNASKVSSCSRSNARTKPQNVIHKDSIQMPYSSSSLLNFSHFSRPAAAARANLQNNERKEMGFVSQPSLDANKELEEPHSVEKTPNVIVDVNAPEKIVEPIGAASSVCSGNSGERASNDLTKNLKRKSRDMEDFDCQSEDIEQESLGTKREATSRGGTGSKRSRAAEVHNLSERRRRDRINEKMRALQELIPNCNKVDKASMLDEAIEYLKTLQLQVQMMSMGSGLCMPPMMFPSGIHPTHVSLFSPMGMGYGMGMGMGMADLNGRSRHPVPSPPTLPPYGHPMLFPQSPMPSFSTHPMQNNNSHIITPTSTQCEVANQSLDQSTFIDKKDQVPQARCSKPGVN